MRVLGLVATLGAVISFFPAFSIRPEPPLDPNNALSTLFVVRYETLIPVGDVNAGCVINHLMDANHNQYDDVGALNWDFRVKRMWQGDEFTIPCSVTKSFKMKPPIVSGDLVLNVNFRPILIPAFLGRTSWQSNFRFILVEASDRTYRWIPEPTGFTPTIPDWLVGPSAN